MSEITVLQKHHQHHNGKESSEPLALLRRGTSVHEDHTCNSTKHTALYVIQQATQRKQCDLQKLSKNISHLLV